MKYKELEISIKIDDKAPFIGRSSCEFENELCWIFKGSEVDFDYTALTDFGEQVKKFIETVKEPDGK
jgi:hypothetical protein